MSKQYVYIANWKSEFTACEALQFATTHAAHLDKLSDKTNSVIVLCPSYESLYPVNQEIVSYSISLGAQDCSEFDPGAHTGQVSALSLAEIGCSYCIIGHSERKKYAHETAEQCAQKTIQALQYKLIPIICIGETEKERTNNQTIEVLEKQLTPIFAALAKAQIPTRCLCIAYEPVWAIGTGKVPTPTDIQEVFNAVIAWGNAHLPQTKVGLLYGGSVDEKTASEFKKIGKLDGFLIGKASLNFQTLEKIVLSK